MWAKIQKFGNTLCWRNGRKIDTLLVEVQKGANFMEGNLAIYRKLTFDLPCVSYCFCNTLPQT